MRSRVLPFWADVSMLEAEVAKPEESDATALSELVRESGATYTGLSVRDGAFIPKLERGREAEQVKVIDAEALDPARSRLVLVVPVDDFPPRPCLASKSWPPSSPCGNAPVPPRRVVPAGRSRRGNVLGAHVLTTSACRRKRRDGRQPKRMPRAAGNRQPLAFALGLAGRWQLPARRRPNMALLESPHQIHVVNRCDHGRLISGIVSLDTWRTGCPR